MKEFENAAEQLRAGRMIIVYDGDEREGEADLMIGAGFVNPGIIQTLRKDGGGLICVAIQKEDAERIGLPFYTDILEKNGGLVAKFACSKTAYGDKPAFSISLNHKDVYTGITDNDRALTINKIGELAGGSASDFIASFYSPGHVFVLIGRGLENRKGHTELALALGKRAGLKTMVLCEMLGVGKALAKDKARAYAKTHGLVYLEGSEIIDSLDTGGVKSE